MVEKPFGKALSTGSETYRSDDACPVCHTLPLYFRKGNV